MASLRVTTVKINLDSKINYIESRVKYLYSRNKKIFGRLSGTNRLLTKVRKVEARAAEESGIRHHRIALSDSRVDSGDRLPVKPARNPLVQLKAPRSGMMIGIIEKQSQPYRHSAEAVIRRQKD